MSDNDTLRLLGGDICWRLTDDGTVIIPAGYVEIQSVTIFGEGWHLPMLERTYLREGQSMIVDPSEMSAPGYATAMVRVSGPRGSTLILSMGGIASRHEIGWQANPCLVKAIADAETHALTITVESVPKLSKTEQREHALELYNQRVVHDADRWRGHEIEWRYSDTGQLVRELPDRACGHCGRSNTAEGHDGCIGALPGAIGACCGHGDDADAYVVFESGQRIDGEPAATWMEWRRAALGMLDMQRGDDCMSDDALRSALWEMQRTRVAVGEALSGKLKAEAELLEHTREIYEAAERGGCSSEALAVLAKRVPVEPLTDDERARLVERHGKRRNGPRPDGLDEP